MTVRLEETVDLLRQADELRIARPDVVDEARNVVWYFDALHSAAVPHVLEELAEELRRLGLERAPGARPLAFGSWIGGDRDGNPSVDSESTARVLDLQLEGSLRRFTEAAEELLEAAWLRELEAGYREQLEESLKSRDWISVFPGRLVLSRFVEAHVGGVNYEAFRNLILDQMVDDRFQPEGMRRVLESLEV